MKVLDFKSCCLKKSKQNLLPKLKYAPESSNHHVIVTCHTSNFRGKFLHHL